MISERHTGGLTSGSLITAGPMGDPRTRWTEAESKGLQTT